MVNSQFWDPKRISDKKEMPESYLKKRKRAPLVAQVEVLTPDTIQPGIAASLSDVRTLPIDWAQGKIVQARQETYLSFSLYCLHNFAVRRLSAKNGSQTTLAPSQSNFAGFWAEFIHASSVGVPPVYWRVHR
jgi:hypothetical protein